MNKILTRSAAFLFAVSCVLTVGALSQATAAEDAAANVKRLADDYFSKRPSSVLARGISAEDATRFQQQFVRELERKFGRRAGYKVGLTSKAVQASVGATAPARGVLFADMLLQNNAEVSAKYGARPIYEPDLMVTVKDEGINNAGTPLEIARHLSELIAFIELPDRIVDESQKMDGNVITAVNVSARLGVLGERTAIQTSEPFIKALGTMTIQVIDGAGNKLATATGDALLGHPLNAVIWLVQDLKRTGEKLKAGDMISLGSFSKPLTPVADEKITVRYEGLPSGPLQVSVRFKE